MDDLANAVAGALIYANRTYRSSFAQHRAPGRVILGYADVKRASPSYGPRKGQRKDYSEHYTNRSGEYGEYGGPGGRLRGRWD